MSKSKHMSHKRKKAQKKAHICILRESFYGRTWAPAMSANLNFESNPEYFVLIIRLKVPGCCPGELREHRQEMNSEEVRMCVVLYLAAGELC